jgi:DNA gyrase subunit A
LLSHNCQSIKFSEKEVRHTGRATQGVRGIKLSKDNYIVSMEVINSQMENLTFLTVTTKGKGKQTPVKNFPKQHRGGKGVKVAETNQKTGEIACAQLVFTECEHLVLTSIKGQIVKLPIKSIPKLSRATQGVILMRFSDKDDYIAAGTCI